MNLKCGDSLSILREMPDCSVNTCITSPPYFGLRDYGEDGQIGLEKSPDEYVARLVEVFREVRRVLRDDGTLWLNLGDSYAAQRGGSHQPAETLAGGKGGKTGDGDRVNRDRHDGYNPTRNASAIGLKHKDLIGIPWRVAFSLQADGWYLRQDIIWHKPNPMPESVKDRCTKAHEYIFLFSKQQKYYFNSDAMREKGVYAAGTKGAKGSAVRQAEVGVNALPPEYKVYDGFRNRRSVWTVNTKPFKGAHFATFPPELIEPCVLAGSPVGGVVLDPFMGAGTTAVVSEKHGREWVGIELNPDYIEIANKRIRSARTDAFVHGQSPLELLHSRKRDLEDLI